MLTIKEWKVDFMCGNSVYQVLTGKMDGMLSHVYEMSSPQVKNVTSRLARAINTGVEVTGNNDTPWLEVHRCNLQGSMYRFLGPNLNKADVYSKRLLTSK